jgi:hypothetical protein
MEHLVDGPMETVEITFEIEEEEDDQE